MENNVYISGLFNESFESPVVNNSKYKIRSIQLNVSGDAVFEVSLFQSNDAENFKYVTRSKRSDLNESRAPIIWDIDNINPDFFKVVVIIVSGSAFFEMIVN